MTTLQQLLDFIKANPPADEYWTDSKWKDELSKSLPGWENIVREQSNWPYIEAVRCGGSRYTYEELCEALMDTAGPKLAIRWLDSHVREQAEEARRWVRNWENWSIDLWAGLNKEETKLDIIYTCFDSYPGEPFATWKEMLRAFHDLAYAIHHREPLPHVAPLPLMPMIGYIPSPHIMKLRSIVHAAGDHESLKIIDELIAQRDRACKSTYQQVQRCFPYTPTRDERELIARVMSIARGSGFRLAALPQILWSLETPPIFVAYPELEEDLEQQRDTREHPIPQEERSRPETISIEEALGCYVPDNPRIILYARGLRWFARRKGLAEEMLRAVVIVHEIGHWVTHLLPKPGIPEWPLELYKLTEDEVHEGWAQLITWWVVDKVGGELEYTFHELNKSQSAPYRVYEKFKTKTPKSVMASLERLRQLRWPARLEEWERLCF
jgi:hypothetical protein